MGVHGKSVLLVYASQSGYDTMACRLGDLGFYCSHAHHAKEALKELTSDQYSAVIIHQGAAGNNMANFCRQVRAISRRLVIFASLTDHNEKLELALFAVDVDDVVTDHHPPACVAKRIAIRLVSRRKPDIDCDTVRIGEVVIDFLNGCIRRDGEDVAMSLRESKLLKYLIANAGETISRLDVFHRVWKDSAVDHTGKNVDMYISRVRKLIEPNYKKPIYLKTVYGHGYKLDLADAKS
jgi:DNA-binding response OmpR family regulator